MSKRALAVISDWVTGCDPEKVGGMLRHYAKGCEVRTPAGSRGK